MLILYVHAHMHVGTRVWLAPTCEWVWYTLGGREGKERSQRSGGHARRTVDRYSNGPFVPAQLARPASRIHSDNDDNDDNGDNDEYDERGVPSLSLSLPLPLISPRGGWYNGQVARPLSSILALFSRGCSLRLVSIIENHPRSFASFENWRFQFRSVRREIILGGDFFSRERDMIDPGIFRQRVERSFGTSIEAVSVGGAGISRYADDGWIWAWKKWSEDVEWHFFLRRFAFCGKSSLKIRGGDWSLRSLFFYSLFFFFVFFNLENNFVRVIEKWFYRERERKR